MELVQRHGLACGAGVSPDAVVGAGPTGAGKEVEGEVEVETIHLLIKEPPLQDDHVSVTRSSGA